MKLSEQIRRAILDSGRSRYFIAKESNVNQSQLSRFAHGKAMLTMDTLDRVAEVLGLEITVREPKNSDEKQRATKVLVHQGGSNHQRKPV